jgi:hypothetical protein
VSSLFVVLAQDPYGRHVLARLADFFADTTPWPRRLWQVSSLLALEEAAEAGAWLANRALSTEAVSWYLRSIQRQAGPDLGLGDAGLRREVNALLGSSLAPNSRQSASPGECARTARKPAGRVDPDQILWRRPAAPGFAALAIPAWWLPRPSTSPSSSHRRS